MRKEKPTADNPLGPLGRMSWRAVFGGALTDYLLSTVILGIIQLMFVQSSGLANAPDETVIQAFQASPIFWVATGLGILFSGVGGFVAGWLADHDHNVHGLVAAMLTNILNATLLSGGANFTGVDFATAMMAIVAGLVGGWLAGRLKQGGRPETG